MPTCLPAEPARQRRDTLLDGCSDFSTSAASRIGAAFHALAWALLYAVVFLAAFGAAPLSARADEAAGIEAVPASTAAVSPATLEFSEALAVRSDAARFPEDLPAQTVKLPDDWHRTRPGQSGPVWYRIHVPAPAAGQRSELLALYISRACSNIEVMLNGQPIYIGGRMIEPITRNCFKPQLIALPAALLSHEQNMLDIKLVGFPLEQVAARHRAAGLSAIELGPRSRLLGRFEAMSFWNVTMAEIVGATLLILGSFILGMGWISRRERHLVHFGILTILWALMSARQWLSDIPLSNFVTETIFSSAFALVAASAVLVMLRYVKIQDRRIDTLLVLQCVLMPASLFAAGSQRMFTMSTVWFSVLAAEIIVAMFVCLRITARASDRQEFALACMAAVAALGVIAYELAVQCLLLPQLPVQLLHVALPVMFLFIGFRLVQKFAHALRAAEAGRETLEGRVQEITAEIERNFAQLAELRVEQVTEKERKRIAADLHDDLGAKLLTIVHTSESERISTLAREALEEMRLSVRGLTGKPVRVADALADWRAETVLRLGQAGIQADWRGPSEDVEQRLSARAYVQTTRILREAVSNMIKHSGATHCKIRCSIGERDFVLIVQDNGRGIPLELDGKLDRGHGMSSMKHRAKQLQGQCLVESGPGYGTVIRLTLPL